MNFEYEFSYRAKLKDALPVGAGPYGTRLFFEVIEGEFAGKRLNGKILSGGGDWLLVGADGFGRLDVRAQFVTDDGAALTLLLAEPDLVRRGRPFSARADRRVQGLQDRLRTRASGRVPRSPRCFTQL